MLAFRWQEFDEHGIRDDTTYEVVESPWRAKQAQLHAVPVEEYAHYKARRVRRSSCICVGEIVVGKRVRPGCYKQCRNMATRTRKHHVQLSLDDARKPTG